jgi:hypothetical protein
MVGFYEFSNEPSRGRSIRAGEFLETMSDYERLKNTGL